MHIRSLLVIGTIAVAVSGVAWAEIYETRDAEGNPVFTDSPTPDSKVVDLPEANVADSVNVPSTAGEADQGEGAKTSPPRPGSEDAGRQDGSPVIEIGDDRGIATPEAGWEIGEAEPRDEVLEAETRKKVLEAEPRHESSGAAPRREVLDAEPRR
jgi:hypothetical protein